MTNIVIDEEELNSLADEAEFLKKSIGNEISYLRDKSKDIFSRYMSYVKVRNLLITFKYFFEIHRSLLVSGHNLNHEIFNTKELKENYWDKIDLSKDPFFIDKDEEDEDKASESDFKKELLNFLRAENRRKS